MRNSYKGRFRVWDRSQDAFNGEDLVYNFDEIDKLIGGPNGASGVSGSVYAGAASTWIGPGDVIPADAASKYPGTKNAGNEFQVGKRTLYSVVSGLNYNDVPLGTVITWWRPSSSTPIPDGWEICNGQTISNHSYPGISGSITLPDLRNKFVIGANPNTAGINAIGGYGHETGATPASSTNSFWSGTTRTSRTPATNTGAPGIGYDSGLEATNALSGSNALRDLRHRHDSGQLSIKDHRHVMDHTHDINPHSHPITPHSHQFKHIHLTPNHTHNFGATNDILSGQNTPGDAQAVAAVTAVRNATITGTAKVAPDDHRHNVNTSLGGTTGDRDPLPNSAGFYPSGGLAAPWPYADFGKQPGSLSWVFGYQHANPTSYPTTFRVSGNTAVAHEPNYNTDPALGSTNLNTAANGGLTTQNAKVADTISGGKSLVATGVLVGDASTRLLTGQTDLTSTGINGDSLQVNVRPQYVGLLYLIKVKVSTNII